MLTGARPGWGEQLGGDGQSGASFPGGPDSWGRSSSSPRTRAPTVSAQHRPAAPDAQKSRPRRFPSAGRERLSPTSPVTSRHSTDAHGEGGPHAWLQPRPRPPQAFALLYAELPPPAAARLCRARGRPRRLRPWPRSSVRSGPRSTCTCPALPGTARPPPLSSVLGPAKLAGASEPLLGCAGVTPTPRPPLLAGPCSLQPPQTCPLQTAQLLGGAVLRSPLRCWPRGRGQGPRGVRGPCGGSGQGGRSC